MSAKKNTAFEVPHGDVSTAVSKFFQELGDDGQSVVEKMKTDPAYVRRLANFAKAGGVAPAGQRSTGKPFPTWKTVTLGTHKDVKALRKALEKAGVTVSEWASNILMQRAFTLRSTEEQLELVKVTGADLGLPNGATRQDIYQAAIAQGLALCPAEVGPQLRLQYLDQPLGDWFLIGMEPITGSAGSPGVFRVEHGDDGRWLGSHGSLGNPKCVWYADNQWVFCRGKKSA